ncbi:MAG: hypothetical protein AB1457_15665 [Chloroflexota bacterium]
MSRSEFEKSQPVFWFFDQRILMLRRLANRPKVLSTTQRLAG